MVGEGFGKNFLNHKDRKLHVSFVDLRAPCGYRFLLPSTNSVRESPDRGNRDADLISVLQRE